jgi:hypothetical protein
MNTILPERATITRKQMEWLKQIADQADVLAVAQPAAKSLDARRAGPGVHVTAARVRDELRALLLEVSKANPWQ